MQASFTPLRRRIFDRIHNVRDLGGYATPNGMTAWGRVYRSGMLSYPTEKDLHRLQALGIHTVIDLRAGYEMDEHPDVIIDGVTYHHVDFLKFLGNVYHPMALAEMYQAIWVKGADSIRDALELIAAGLESGQAVLFHCAVGKDRTGILAALLLSLCEVDLSDILADYQTSHTYLTKFFLADLPEEIDLNHPGIQSPPQTMADFLTLLDEQGGVRSSLRSIGVSDATMDKLVQYLTHPLPAQEGV